MATPYSRLFRAEQPQTTELLSLPINSSFIDQDTVIPDNILLLQIDVSNSTSMWKDVNKTQQATENDDPVLRIDNVSSEGIQYIQYLSTPSASLTSPYKIHKPSTTIEYIDATLSTNTDLTMLKANKNYLNLYKYSVYFVGDMNVYCPAWTNIISATGQFIATPFAQVAGYSGVNDSNAQTTRSDFVIKRAYEDVDIILNRNVSSANSPISNNHGNITTFIFDSNIGELIPYETLNYFDKDNVNYESEVSSVKSFEGAIPEKLKVPGSYAIGLGNVAYTPASYGDSSVSQNVKEFRVYTGAHNESQRNSVLSELKTKWGIV